MSGLSDYIALLETDERLEFSRDRLSGGIRIHMEKSGFHIEYIVLLPEIAYGAFDELTRGTKEVVRRMRHEIPSPRP